MTWLSLVFRQVQGDATVQGDHGNHAGREGCFRNFFKTRFRVAETKVGTAYKLFDEK